MEFVTTHKKTHIAQLWRLPECGMPDTADTYQSWYARAVELGLFPEGTEVNFCVPAVDRGFWMAGLAAKEAGVPIRRIIVASNENRAATRLIREGVYEADTAPAATGAPLLDVGCYREAEALCRLPAETRLGLFAAYSCPYRRWKNMQEKVKETWDVSLAPSTAVSYVALQDHRCVTADGLHAILFSLEGSV